jgi:hypothetical protein
VAKPRSSVALFGDWQRISLGHRSCKKARRLKAVTKASHAGRSCFAKLGSDATPGEVSKTLATLKESPATAKAKAKFILSTDGVDFEAEDLVGGETVAVGFIAKIAVGV